MSKWKHSVLLLAVIALLSAFVLFLDHSEAQAASSSALTLVKKNGTWYCYQNGKICYDSTLVKHSNGEWYYVSGGTISTKTTGLVKYNDSWYYIKDGKLASKTTTLVKHFGEWFYVVNGKVASNTTKLVKWNGEWWYVVNGKIASKTTTLVKYSDAWYYIVKGKVATNTTTLVKYNGGWYYVIQGKVASNTTTLVQYNYTWYYVKNGKTQPNATTLVKYNGQWYYIEKGVYTRNTLFFTYNSRDYYVLKGIAQMDYSGAVTYVGKVYYVYQGVLTGCHQNNHTYENQVCRYCGTVDQKQAYDYLMGWMRRNGQKTGNFYSVSYFNGQDSVALVLDSSDYTYLYMSWVSNTNQGYYYATLDLDDYSYHCGVDSYYMKGFVQAESFTKNSKLTYETYDAPSESKESMRQYSKEAVCMLLDGLQTILQDNKIGITLADLGFIAYK